MLHCLWFQASVTSANPTGSGSSSGSGLTGWAAFGAKTSASLSAGSKLGSSGPSGSGHKALTPPPGQKPVGLSGLAGAKSGLGGAKIPGSGNGNGSSQVPLKPPPPLTLGKQPLNRSSSAENQGKGAASSGGSSPGSSQASAGGNGGSNGGGNGNGSKVVAGDKAPTSQESQFNAMKRLQLVKKKAAQKKLKK